MGKVVKSCGECLRDAEGNARKVRRECRGILEENARKCPAGLRSGIGCDNKCFEKCENELRGECVENARRECAEHCLAHPPLFFAVIPASERESPLHCDSLIDGNNPRIFGSKCSVLLQDLSVVHNR